MAENRPRYGKSVRFAFMKILIATGIYPPDVGGPATYSARLAKEFPERGHDVKVLSFGSFRFLPKFARHFFYFINVLWMGHDRDVIFAQDPVSVGFVSVIASKILRKKFVIRIAGDYAWEQGVMRFGVKELLDGFLDKEYGFFVELLKKMERFSARHANTIIVPSNYLAGVLQKWGIDKSKIFLIYNTVSFLERIPKKEARRKLGISQDKNILFAPGREVPWKGFKMLKDLDIQNARLVVGTFPRDEYTLWLSACDIFLLNTGYEGFSHQILEAMAFGKPIITTDAGGNKEIVKNGENALAVEYNNKEAWRAAITNLLADPKLQEIISQGAKETAKKFLEKDMAGETIKVLGSVI